MRAFLLGFALVAMAGSAPAQNFNPGYVTPNGTYVPPHYSSTPNSTRLDNYSTRGNVNPYTGQAGTVNPYATPAPAPVYQPPASIYSNPYRRN